MGKFARAAALAERLIDANGRPVQIIKFGTAPVDDQQPWRGQREYFEAVIPGIAAFIPQTQILASITEPDEEGTRRSRQYALFAANNDQGYNLEEFDALRDGGVIWRIVRTEVLGPADRRVLYQFLVEK